MYVSRLFTAVLRQEIYWDEQGLAKAIGLLFDVTYMSYLSKPHKGKSVIDWVNGISSICGNDISIWVKVYGTDVRTEDVSGSHLFFPFIWLVMK